MVLLNPINFLPNPFTKLVMNSQTTDQSLVEGQAFSFTLRSNTFGDAPANTIAYSASLTDGTVLPSWISFDPNKLTFSGVAPTGIAGTGIRVQATDTTGAMSEEAFHLYPATGILSLNKQENDVQLSQAPNSQFSVVLPVGSFVDSIAGRTITLSATQTDGTPLPTWLTFDLTTATLTGTAPAWNFDQQVEVLATASDGVVSAEAFHIRNAPVTLQRTFSTAPGTAFSMDLISAALPANLGQISVRSLSGNPLPDGITATGVQTTIYGSPIFIIDPNGVPVSNSPTMMPGPITDTLTGTMPTTAQKVSVLVDYLLPGAPQHSTTEVDLSLIPNTVIVPALSFQTHDVRLTLGSAFTLSVGDTFNSGTSLTDVITATGEGGAALPSWMKYDPMVGAINGTAPLNATSTGVVITDTNKAGFAVSEEFHVYAQAALPKLVVQTGDVRVMLGNAFSTIIAPGSFTDPDGGAVSLSVAGQGGAALPTWMTYDAVTGILSGTAPTTQTTQNVVVTATSSKGGVAAESFNVYGQPVAPASSVQQDDLRFRAGSNLSVVLDPNAFSTTAGNPVTLAATQQDGTALPAWMSFNSTTDTFSGNAPITPATVGVAVIATDTYGRTAAEGFSFISSAPAAAASPGAFGLIEAGQFVIDLGSIFYDSVGSTAFVCSATFSGSDPALASLALSPTGILTGNIPSTIPLNSTWNVNVMGVGNQGSVGNHVTTIYNGYGMPP